MEKSEKPILKRQLTRTCKFFCEQESYACGCMPKYY